MLRRPLEPVTRRVEVIQAIPTTLCPPAAAVCPVPAQVQPLIIQVPQAAPAVQAFPQQVSATAFARAQTLPTAAIPTAAPNVFILPAPTAAPAPTAITPTAISPTTAFAPGLAPPTALQLGAFAPTGLGPAELQALALAQIAQQAALAAVPGAQAAFTPTGVTTFVNPITGAVTTI